MGAEHVKGVAEVRGILLAVPAPVGIGVGEMARAGAVGDAIFAAIADLMPIRGSMGMDASAIAGEDEAVLKGRDDGGETEEALEPFFIMERGFFMGQGISGQGVCDSGMPVGKFLAFTRCLGRF
ncbi:MAG: hypothetical protein J1E98_02990 [Lachnospiraceae bacterium]|nr:hypothetical protein [Lachnospiraceae bacterium]